MEAGPPKRGLGYVIGRPYWGQGIITEILERMLRFGFETMSLNRLWAICDDENIGSWRVMEKCALKQEGFFLEHMRFKGRIRNTCQYAILKREWRG